MMPGVHPIHVEPHERYWRRRANRRVRKARWAVRLARWSVILLVNGIVAATLIYTVEKGVELAKHTPGLAIERIELQGVRYASSEKIRTRVNRYLGRNILGLDLALVERDLARDPWVRSARIRRVLPHTLQVRLSERVPVALAMIGDRAHLVDATGYVIGPVDVAAARRFPVLTGVDRAEDRELEAALRRGVGVLLQLRRAHEGFTRAVAEIDLARDDRVTLQLRGGGPAIVLDPELVVQNLLHFLELREAIDRRVGAAEYVDLRWRDRISVKPQANGRKL